ncbi:MAG: periplasmic heavy metal sensor [Proteobacteria bacterium]|nr:periplasmic heavy metal sensor [Pseudomonadota bacterium]
MKRTMAITTLIMLTLAWAFTAEAQWWGRGRGGAGKGTGPGWSADFEGLNLTQDQKKSLDSLHQAFWKNTAPLSNKIEQKRLEMNSLLLEPKPDVQKVTRLQKELSDLESQFSEKRLSCQLEARKILTPEQIAQLPPGCTLGFGNMLSGPGYGCGMGPGYGCGKGPGYGCGRGPGFGRGCSWW